MYKRFNMLNLQKSTGIIFFVLFKCPSVAI